MVRNLLNTLSSRATLLFTCLLLALTLAPPPPPPKSQLSLISTVHAATINVDSTCNINQAIATANNDSSSGGCEAGSGADTINISGTATAISNLPSISSAIDIIGTNNATIDGANQFRLIAVTATGNVTIRNLTLTGGRAGSGSAVSTGAGGGTITIENSVIRNNTNTSNGGHIDISAGTHTIRNSVIHSNTNSSPSSSNAGILLMLGGTLTIENSTFYNNSLSNTANTRDGGMLLSGGTATLTHVTMVGHHNTLGIGSSTNVHMRNSLITGAGISDCYIASSNTLRTNAGNFIADGSCSPALSGNPQLAPFTNGLFPLYEGSPAIDAAVAAHCLRADQRGVARNSATCDIGAYEGSIPRPKAKRKPKEEPYIPPTPMPPTYTGLSFFQQTGIRVSATHGLRSGVQFKRIGAPNIGLPSVLNNGFIDAVDIFGYVEQGVEVCFPQSGALIFLDAATSPRTVLPWPSTIVDSFTCGRITRPGTLVLVPHNSPLAGPVSTPQPAPTIPRQPSSSGLTDCFVTTTHILNLRATPNGDIIGRVSYNATLSARGREGSWYQITVDGLSGWISADFTQTRGNCS